MKILVLRFRLLAVCLLLFSIHAHASVTPYWGDRGCRIDGDDHACDGLFPALFVDFHNPDTAATARVELQFVGNHYSSSQFKPERTEEYRLVTGCMICDVYDGIFMFGDDDAQVPHADVFQPYGFETTVDTGHATIVFNGTRISPIDSGGWEGWTPTPNSRDANLDLWVNRTWTLSVYQRGDAIAETHGTWHEVTGDSTRAAVTVTEPATFWLLIVGLPLLFLHHWARPRKGPIGPPAG